MKNSDRGDFDKILNVQNKSEQNCPWRSHWVYQLLFSLLLVHYLYWYTQRQVWKTWRYVTMLQVWRTLKLKRWGKGEWLQSSIREILSHLKSIITVFPWSDNRHIFTRLRPIEALELCCIFSKLWKTDQQRDIGDPREVIPSTVWRECCPNWHRNIPNFLRAFLTSHYSLSTGSKKLCLDKIIL